MLALTLAYNQFSIRVYKHDGFAYVPSMDIAQVLRGSKVFELLPQSYAHDKYIDDSVFNMKTLKEIAEICINMDMDFFGQWLLTTAIKAIEREVGNSNTSAETNKIVCFNYDGKNIRAFKDKDTIHIDAKQLYIPADKSVFIKQYIDENSRKMRFDLGSIIDIIDIDEAAIVGKLYELISHKYGEWITKVMIPRLNELRRECLSSSQKADSTKCETTKTDAVPKVDIPKKSDFPKKSDLPKETPKPEATGSGKAVSPEPTGHTLVLVELLTLKYLLYVDMHTEKKVYDHHKQWITKTWSFDDKKSAKGVQYAVMLTFALHSKIRNTNVIGLSHIAASTEEIIAVVDALYAAEKTSRR